MRGVSIFALMQMACTSQPIDFDTIHSTADGDGDGFDSSLDCDDDEPTISPGAQEVCDGIDNDCDGLIDEGLTSLWHLDEDGDGQGSSVSAIESCETLLDRVTDDSDCDDTQASVYAGAPEVCDGMFNDCDDLRFLSRLARLFSVSAKSTCSFGNQRIQEHGVSLLKGKWIAGRGDNSHHIPCLHGSRDD